MINSLLTVLEVWKDFWREGWYQYLLLAAGLCLLIRRKKMKEAGLLVAYLALGLFFFWFPLTADLIQKCIGTLVYWRYLWVLPTLPVIAYAMTEVCGNISHSIGKMIAVAVFSVLLAVSGKSIWNADLYEKVENRQKVPETVAAVCEMIRQDAGENEVCLAADDNLAAFIRVYDPSILMCYGRRAEGAKNRYDMRMYRMLTDPSIPVEEERVVKLANKMRCNYLVVPFENPETQNAYMEAHGYQNIGNVNEFYWVYRKK